MNNPNDKFLDMQEHPEKYSDEQLEAMMDDIDRTPDTDAAWQKFECEKIQTPHQPTANPALSGRGRSVRRWLRIAAVLGGIIFLAGIAYATIHLLISRDRKENLHKTTLTTISISTKRQETNPVVFENVSLDSILSAVSSHYKKTVVFHDDAPRRMKLIMTWHPDAPLTDFIDRLNAFDGLSLHIQNDTIIVEHIMEEVE